MGFWSVSTWKRWNIVRETHEESVEGQAHNVGNESEHHDVDLDILESHHQTTECSQLITVGIRLTDILQHAQLSDLALFLGETTGVVRKIRQDEASQNGEEHRHRALNPEQPAPGGVTEGSLHVGEHTGTDESGEGIGDQVSAEQDGIAGGQLAASVPLGENEEGTGEESGLDETQQESDGNHVAEVLGVAGQGGDDTPQQHGNGDVDGGPRDAVDEHVGRHLHDDVADIQDTQTGRVFRVGEGQILLQTLETGSGHVVAVEVVHDVDEHEQTAAGIQLPLQLLLDDHTACRVHLGKGTLW